MRLFFLTLLVLNLMYFGLQLRDELDWQATHSNAGVPVPVTTPALRVVREPVAAPEPELLPPPAKPVVAPSALVLAFGLPALPSAVPLPVLHPYSLAWRTHCRRYGPMRERAEQQALLAQLVRLGLLVRAHDSQRPRVGLHMVQVRLPTPESAREYLRQLQSKGLEDIRLIEGVGSHRDISLGVFSSRASAERRVRFLGEHGVVAQIAPYGRGKVEMEYWLDVMIGVALAESVYSLAVAHEPLDCRAFIL